MAERSRRREPVYEESVVTRRPASTAEFIAVVVALAQAAGGLVLAALCVQGSTGVTTDVAVSGTALLFTGGFFGVLAVLIGIAAWPVLRGSMGARVALAGLEAVFAVAGYLLIPTVGILLTISAVIVVLFVTVLSGIGRRNPV